MGVNGEFETVAAMVHLYCRAHHGPRGQLCEECAELLNYARARLDKCPFALQKPTCLKCTVHCYRPAMRERIREVMRYAGPRMLLHHPVLALRHIVREKQWLLPGLPHRPDRGH